MGYDRFFKYRYNEAKKWTGKHEFEELSRNIIGVAIKVHRELGPGFLENIYEEALKIEFSEQSLNFDFQKEIKIVI